MKVYEMVAYLERYDVDADIFVEDEQGILHDFRLEHRDATFDGFDTAYDEGVNIINID